VTIAFTAITAITAVATTTVAAAAAAAATTTAVSAFVARHRFREGEGRLNWGSRLRNGEERVSRMTKRVA
jgi:hypothetical protein